MSASILLTQPLASCLPWRRLRLASFAWQGEQEVAATNERGAGAYVQSGRERCRPAQSSALSQSVCMCAWGPAVSQSFLLPVAPSSGLATRPREGAPLLGQRLADANGHLALPAPLGPPSPDMRNEGRAGAQRWRHLQGGTELVLRPGDRILEEARRRLLVGLGKEGASLSGLEADCWESFA